MCGCAGLKRGERKAIAVRPQAMLEAKDLPRCDLSDFLEARIAKALDEDRSMRAQRKGVSIDQVQPQCSGSSDLSQCMLAQEYPIAPTIASLVEGCRQ